MPEKFKGGENLVSPEAKRLNAEKVDFYREIKERAEALGCEVKFDEGQDIHTAQYLFVKKDGIEITFSSGKKIIDFYYPIGTAEEKVINFSKNLVEGFGPIPVEIDRRNHLDKGILDSDGRMKREVEEK